MPYNVVFFGDGWGNGCAAALYWEPLLRATLMNFRNFPNPVGKPSDWSKSRS